MSHVVARDGASPRFGTVNCGMLTFPHAFEVVDALDGFCRLEKRSPTLDGSVPVRAAQGCKPFLDGNAAGLQLRLAQPAALARDGEDVALQLDAATVTALERLLPERVEQLVERGRLARDGHWHRLLREGIAWRSGPDALSLWTGLLVRAAPGAWILLSGARNRRCPVTAATRAIADDERFVPVVLELRPSSLGEDRRAPLDSELGCLTPLWPDAAFATAPLAARPQVGARHRDFYSRAYAERRRSAQPSGRYRRLVADDADSAADGTAACELVHAGGPQVHRVERFRTLLTADGPTDRHPRRERYEFVELRTIADVHARSDGRGVHDVAVELGEERARLRRDWRRLYDAPEDDPALAMLDVYATGVAPPLREPLLLVLPWAFVVTPPGWSSVLDTLGDAFAGLEGLRGVVATDRFAHLAPTYEATRPGPLAIPRGAAIGHVLPVPRALLAADAARVPW